MATYDYLQWKRFIKLNMEGFEEYTFRLDEQFQEDLNYLHNINSREIFDRILDSDKGIVKQVDKLLDSYFNQKDRI